MSDLFGRITTVLGFSAALLCSGTAVAQSTATGAVATPPSAAAAVANARLAPGFTALQPNAKVLLMPIDIELFNISGGGVVEPRADWTASAQKHVLDAVRALAVKSNWQLVETDATANDQLLEHIQLNNAMLFAINIHHNRAPLTLPTKAGQLDWTMGDALKPIAAATGARYALFTNIRDAYASAERKAAMVATMVVGALFGVAIAPAGGQQIAQGSLVDLETGRVLWFNRLQRASGDLREAAPAQETTGALFRDLPAAAAP